MTSELSTFVIGDVHGRWDLLSLTLHELLFLGALHPRIVFLGDVIDRGPHSKDCLDLVMEELRFNPESVLLSGNHEDLMLRFLSEGGEKRSSWLENGGGQALLSYGYSQAQIVEQGSDGDWRVRPDFPRAFQEKHAGHIEMVRQAPDYLEVDDHIFVHAGIDPTLPMSEQDPFEMRWMSKFPDYSSLGTRTVVHGHVVTTSHMPEIYDNRIAIDTGAFKTGRLTTMLIRAGSEEPEFYSTLPRPRGGFDFDEVQPLDFRTMDERPNRPDIGSIGALVDS